MHFTDFIKSHPRNAGETLPDYVARLKALAGTPATPEPAPARPAPTLRSVAARFRPRHANLHLNGTPAAPVRFPWCC